MSIDLRRCLAIAMFFIVNAGFSVAETGPSATDPDKSKSAATGEVRVMVKPDEAYIFVDGKPTTHRNSTLKLAPGDHTITVANYGYAPHTEKVTVVAGERKEIVARLASAGGPVSGPWGRIQIEGAPSRAAVFLNGTTPGFFVGHVDEMNNNFFNVQELIVPPGKHQLYLVRPGETQPYWSGPIDVRENQRLIVYVKGHDKAKMVYKGWSQGKKIKSLKRFDAGTATATIAVAPVDAKLAVNTPVIHCDQTGNVTWSSENTGATTLTANQQPVADTPSGNLDVQPKQTTKYELRAAGPGGVVTRDAAINVDSTVKTSLSVSQPEVRFVKEGDTIKEQGSADLVWSASNADSVQIDRIGPVSGTSGTQTVQPTPASTTTGTVDETQTYQIVAKNDCGGSDTSTASIHLTGSIEPAPTVAEAKPPELPHTASPLPLLALVGLVLATTGGILLGIRTLKA